jgi:hypothetical protein
MTANAVCLNKVDFPPMFGPVTKRSYYSLFSIVSLGMNPFYF